MRILLVSISILMVSSELTFAQDIYVYPNKRLANDGVLEYRRYTLEEAQTYQEGGSFDPYLPLDWGPERRLTEQENVYRARVVTSGDNIFTAYPIILGQATYFIRSLNSGHDWEPYITLEDTTRVLFHFYPEIIRDGSNLLIGLMAQLEGHGNNLCFYRSSDLGASWSSINEVFSYFSDDCDHYSSYCSFGQHVYASYRNNERDSIYVLRSTNWGDAWNGRGVNVAWLNSTPQPMTVRASGNTVHLVWVNENHPISCRYSRSTDQGQTWSEEIDISGDSSGAQVPYIAVQDTHVVVCWMGYKYSPYMFTGDLFIRQSFDSGETWGEEQVLTGLHKVRQGTIYCEDSLISAVWMDARLEDGNDEVMASISYDYGTTWTGEERLSHGDNHSYDPISCKTSESIHVFWGDIRPNAPGLYYCVNDPSTDIEDKKNSPALNISLNSYPNPFNANTLITYREVEGGDIGIYDITGRLIRTLKTGSRSGWVAWDATDETGNRVSSGVYFIRARTATGYASKKVIYLQ